MTIISWRTAGVGGGAGVGSLGAEGKVTGTTAVILGGTCGGARGAVVVFAESTSHTVYPPLRKRERSRSDPVVHCVKPRTEPARRDEERLGVV